MANTTPFSLLCILLTTFTLIPTVSAQRHAPYPHAVTDRLIHQETPMLPPPRNVIFADPDFGSSIVRATDASTNLELPRTFLRTEGSGVANEWSADTRKFYVIDSGGQTLVFAFDPATMTISSLPNTMPGQGLLLPLRAGASFSFNNSDLIYGTADADTLTIRSYDFSTGTSTAVIDTTTCGLQPALVSGPSVVSDDDVTPSLDDNRVSISEGGSQFGDHMFVVVYDKHLGCRWYNTQTGQIGGQWGAAGVATAASFLIRHAYLSRSGKHVLISTNGFGWHVWDLATLNVSTCATGSLDEECDGYQAVGYDSLVNGPGITGDMQTAKRPLDNISQIEQLVSPVLYQWSQEQHFTWSNVDVHDRAPVCGSTHSYDADTSIDEPFAGEIFCLKPTGWLPRSGDLPTIAPRISHPSSTHNPSEAFLGTAIFSYSLPIGTPNSAWGSMGTPSQMSL